MKKTKSVKPAVANAMIWAAMMIASSLLMADPSEANSKMMIILMVAGWFATQRLVPGSKQLLANERACFRRLLGRSE